MKTYLEELKGQVRGNARLRRKLDRARHREEELARHIAVLVSKLDALGRGGEQAVVSAAQSIGWKRGLSAEERAALERWSKESKQ